MYSVNDIVTYGLHGVCKISEIASRNIDGKAVDYYILKPIYDDSFTIAIPVENEALTHKMRLPLTKEEIYALINALPERNDIWIENESARVKAYKEALAMADMQELLLLFKSLVHRKKEQEHHKKRLHNVDERFFKNIESALYNEISYVLELNEFEIDTLLQNAIR
jgi:CarD family transcriptional regulator